MGLIVWAAVAGALLCWVYADFEFAGFFVGGLFGGLMGLWLRSALRDEIAAAVNNVLDDRLEAARRLRAEPAPMPAPDATEPAPTVVPSPPTSAMPVSSQPPVSRQAVPVTVSAQPREPAMGREAAADQADSGAPTLIEGLFASARDWLLGGNTIVRVGLVVLFLGLVFLARFAAMAGLYPIEARLATVAAVGIALLGVGLAKRTVRRDFSLSMQGAGLGVLYLVVFAGARAYDVLPVGAAFAFMILFAALGCALAVLQDALAMALASFLGGFAVPLLLGGNAETPLALFGYMTILNLAILFIAWKKSWRSLNLLGFFSTFALATVWGLASYADRHYLLCQVFLIISIAIYLAAAVLYAHNTPGRLGNYADSTLLFGTALAGFGLQIALVHARPFASAWSALAFGTGYVALAALLMRRRRTEMRLLNECLLAIGVGFATLAVPLALDVKWTSASWALEGAGAFWIGARQARWMPRAFGLILQVVAAALALGSLGPNVSAIPFANNGFMLPMLVAIPVLFTAWFLRHRLEHSGSRWAAGYARIEHEIGAVWFLLGFFFVCVALLREVSRTLPPVVANEMPVGALNSGIQVVTAMVALLGAMVLADAFGERKNWAVARWPGRAGLPVLWICFLLSAGQGNHVLAWPGVVFWLAAAVGHLWLLWRQPVNAWTHAMHVGGVLLLTAIVADSIWLAVDRADLWGTSWAGVAFLASATAMLAVLTRWAGPVASPRADLACTWPLRDYARAYWLHAGIVLVHLVYFGALATTVIAEGIADPLPYVPVLNPVDLSALLALVVLLLWGRLLLGAVKDAPMLVELAADKAGMVALAVLAFVIANTIWLRTAHHFLGVPWDNAALAESQVVEAGISLLWTLIAMALMFLARSRQQRLPWLAGASLLGAVVLKLVFVDMSAVEGLARIVAFIGVGVLMLLIGYFVPLPPRRETGKEVAA